MVLVFQRYLVVVSGNDNKRVLSDAWRLNSEGDRHFARMYATTQWVASCWSLRESSGTTVLDCCSSRRQLSLYKEFQRQ
ncbi:hypothetical protein AMTRI_Chr13g85970 [Amborella trichopoda]